MTKHLMLELNRKQIPPAVMAEFAKHRTTIVGELFNAIREEQLTERQLTNALRVLCTLRSFCGFRYDEDLLTMCLLLMDSNTLSVRSEATSIAIALTRVNVYTVFKIPSGQYDIVRPYVEKAVQKGLHPPEVQALAESFLAGEF
ncbi:MAG: hypothetical protein ACLFVO_28845 [Chloroflexaceae bacterium]